MRRLEELKEKVLEGDTWSLARAISLVENEDPLAIDLLKELYPHTGNAYLLGVTGPPGAGKSTLVDKLIEHYRKTGLRVAVLAVDPSSPFSGGAILGDRIRMQRHATDPEVFIRSMGNRGHLGGLSLATGDAAKILDAAHYETIILETVGIGQAEVEVASHVDTTLLVVVPGLGDDVQVLKAGIMEIADIFVVNKADREGVERCVAEIEQLLSVREMDEQAFTPPIVKVVARENQGISELAQAIEEHREYLIRTGEWKKRRKARIRKEVYSLITDQLERWAQHKFGQGIRELEEVEAIFEKKTDPHSVAEEIISELGIWFKRPLGQTRN